MIASNTSGTPFPSLALIGRASVGIKLQHLRNRMFRALDIRTRQIDLIDDRDNGEVVGHRQVHIGNRLGLHPLCRIDQQERPFAGRQTARHFIGKIDVPRRIDQMQGIRLPVLGLIPDRHCVGLDRNAAFTLQVHGIENLVFRLSGSDCASSFQEPVSEG